MIYLDSSALLKLLFEESESEALEQWVSERPDTARVSSEVVRAEVVRAARRLDASAAPAARTLVSQLDLVPLDTRLVEEAAEVGEPELRTLDAIHLASALSLRDELTEFVAYDLRLAGAAEASGLRTVRPGTDRRG
jgi:predicted nucleic acid-binding protein